MWNRVGSWAIALVVGVVYGAAGSVAHASTLWGLPVGVVVAVVGAAALILAMRLLTHDRWCALAGGLGMMLATFVLAQTSPGGSTIFTTVHQTEALVWMAAPPLATALVVAWPDLSRVRDGRGTTSPR
ncbi:MAG: DUF6113 family protein [Microbacterium sp.]|uniref:DUF6113 family protein n=1 Tax=Microbacterium sp. TaxID=51671 RepID=UPI0039E6C27E